MISEASEALSQQYSGDRDVRLLAEAFFAIEEASARPGRGSHDFQKEKWKMVKGKPGTSLHTVIIVADNKSYTYQRLMSLMERGKGENQPLLLCGSFDWLLYKGPDSNALDEHGKLRLRGGDVPEITYEPAKDAWTLRQWRESKLDFNDVGE